MRHYPTCENVGGIAGAMLVLLSFMGMAAAQEASRNDVLAWKAGRFYLEGQPFAEISFNKFDLFWAVNDARLAAAKEGTRAGLDKALAAQEEALCEIREIGCRTIRIFGSPWGTVSGVYDDPAQRAEMFAAMDAVLAMCERQGVKVIYSLGAAGFHDQQPRKKKVGEVSRDDATRPEGLYELVADAHSRSRTRLCAYIDEVIARYRHSRAIAMWEITNELTNQADIGKREWGQSPTLAQVAAFSDQVAARIKAGDPMRLVSNGGSHLRESAWNLFQRKGWRKDSMEEHGNAFGLVFAKSAVDVIDIHYYAVRTGGYEIVGTAGRTLPLTPSRYMEFARGLGKALIFGEFAALPSKFDGDKSPEAGWFSGYDDPGAKAWVQKAVDSVVEAGIPLSYYWAYGSDRPMDQNPNPTYLDKKRTPALIQIIVEANHRLKAKLGTM
ncbi:MAG TPA: cellulase family glycosylhydrolase [Verrucomicrobiae bacterium]|nr:cellulase family glycosylhydrolase [Verrucomicrobiae bacterium]